LLQVAVASLILRQQDDVVVLAIASRRRLALREVCLAAEDRLDAVRFGLLVELDGPEHVAVVGDRDGLHAPLLDGLAQVLGPDGAIEEAVLGVQVEVSEIVHSCKVTRGVDRHAGQGSARRSAEAFREGALPSRRLWPYADAR